MVKALVTGGWLNLKVGGRPGQGLPGGGGPVDPGWGVDEGERPEVEPPEPGEPTHPWVPPSVGIWPSPGRPSHPIYWPIPKPPVGIWPPPTPEHPIQPVPPENGGGEGGGTKPIDPDARPEHPIYEPGTVWPPPNAVGKFVVLAWIPGQGWKYIVIDASLKPTHPIAPGGEEPHPEPR